MHRTPARSSYYGRAVQRFQSPPCFDRRYRMRRRVPETFRLYRKSRVTERCSRFAFQMDEGFRETLIHPHAHVFHVRDEVAVGEEKFGGENLGSHLDTLVQIRYVAVGDPQVSITKEVFQLVGHGENLRILR